MLQVATLDSWSADVMRPLMRPIVQEADAQGVMVELQPAWNSWEWAVAAFFVSYIITVAIVLINVIVAVLLQGFLSAIDEEDRRIEMEERQVKRHTLSGPIDPVLEALSDFSSEADLESMIAALFSRLDVDDSGKLSYSELKSGLASLDIQPAIELSPDDFHALTHQMALCAQDSVEGPVLDAANFGTAIRLQIKNYSERLLAQHMQTALENNDGNAALLLAVKTLLARLCHIGPAAAATPCLRLAALAGSFAIRVGIVCALRERERVCVCVCA